MAMKRLEEEFKHMLVENRQPFEQKHASVFLSAVDADSKSSLGDYLLENSDHRDILFYRNSEEFIIDLVQYDVISELRRFANFMFISGYGGECSMAYISIRRAALDECLFILEKEKPRIENVLYSQRDNFQSQLDSIKSKNRRWIQTMKIFVRNYLASEKWLSEQIFGELGTVNLVSFAEDLILQLWKYFGAAIPSSPINPVKLFHILDMYEVLAGLHPNMDSLHSDKDISRVRLNRDEVLRRLADSVRPTLHEFQNSLITYVRTSANFTVEGIHPLTKYVMTYISTLVDYMETLNFLLQDNGEEDPMLASPCLSSDVEEENVSGGTCDFSSVALSFRSDASILKWLYSGSPMSSAMQEESISGGTSNFSPTSLQWESDSSLLKWFSDGFPISSATEEERITGCTCDIPLMALHSRVVASILQYKLYNEAKSFKDASLQHIFLMSNIHYVVEKVKNSKLIRFMLGEEWIGEHKKKLQQLVRNYEKITWSPVLSILNDEGSNSNFVSKALLRERLRSFYLAFEEVYRSQTTCLIPDSQLREDLRNSASLKAIHAYKKFVELHANHIGGKHIKYSSDDLQNRLLHLFEGVRDQESSDESD